MRVRRQSAAQLHMGTPPDDCCLGKHCKAPALLIAIPVLIGITIIDYAIMCLAGSPLQMLQGPRISQAAVAAKEIALGLDKPFYVQYFVWLKQAFTWKYGLFDQVLSGNSEMIASHLGPTLFADGRIASGQLADGGARRNLQCDQAVFRRRLYGCYTFLPGKQRARIFPFFTVDLSVYGKACIVISPSPGQEKTCSMIT